MAKLVSLKGMNLMEIIAQKKQSEENFNNALQNLGPIQQSINSKYLSISAKNSEKNNCLNEKKGLEERAEGLRRIINELNVSLVPDAVNMTIQRLQQTNDSFKRCINQIGGEKTPELTSVIIIRQCINDNHIRNATEILNAELTRVEQSISALREKINKLDAELQDLNYTLNNLARQKAEIERTMYVEAYNYDSCESKINLIMLFGGP